MICLLITSVIVFVIVLCIYKFMRRKENYVVFGRYNRYQYRPQLQPINFFSEKHTKYGQYMPWYIRSSYKLRG